jgi:hypothetical protein
LRRTALSCSGSALAHKASVVPTAYSFDHYVHIRMDLFEPRGPLAGPPPPSDDKRLDPALDWIAAALPRQSAEVLGGLDGSIEFVLTGPGARTLTAGSGETLGRVTIDSPAFVRAVTQRANWDGARIEAASSGLSAAVLGLLRVF